MLVDHPVMTRLAHVGLSAQQILIMRFYLQHVDHSDIELGCYLATKHLMELGLELTGNLFDEGTPEALIWDEAVTRHRAWCFSNGWEPTK